MPEREVENELLATVAKLCGNQVSEINAGKLKKEEEERSRGCLTAK